jgi:ABC-2 type transport system permease protein
MASDVRLYLRYVSASLRSQMQYRASFIMLSIGHFLGTGVEFLALWALFDRFGTLRGWTLPEIAFFYGAANVAFATSESLARSFDNFSELIKSGEFDRILLRPRGAALQVAGREAQLMRIGRFTQGVVVLLWAAAALGVRWTVPRVALLIASLVGGTCLFCGLFVLQATMAFWTTETLEIWNTVTYGGVETAQYPISVYRPWFRAVFTFVVPLAAVTYYPSLPILGRADALGSPVWFQRLSPLIGVAFLVVALRVWRLGVRHYRSTGS